jgi:hypothetical protein
MKAIKTTAKKKGHEKGVQEVGTVYMTYDYDLFTFMEGNRPVNELHLKRIAHSMQENYLLSPILVNERYEIVDGQHRFNAAVQNGLPVYYIIGKGYGLKEVHRLNSNHRNWSVMEYAAGYASMGQKDYSIYMDFADRFGFSHDVNLRLLVGKWAGGKNELSNLFKLGDFKVHDLKKAEETARKIFDCMPYYEGCRRRTFIYALVRALNHPDFAHDVWLRKLSINSSWLVDCTKTSEYLVLIEKIYNYKSRKKINLRF